MQDRGRKTEILHSSPFLRPSSYIFHVHVQSFFRPQNHDEMIALTLHRLINFGGIRQTFDEFLELVDAVLFITELAAAQNDRDLDHVPLRKELAAASRLPIEIPCIGAEAETNHFHLGLLAVRLLPLLLLFELVEVTAVIPDLYDWRNRLGRHFDEIKP